MEVLLTVWTLFVFNLAFIEKGEYVKAQPDTEWHL